jgi:purine-nucleoside phosphorylase
LWGDLGVLAVEMEAAVIFTIAAMRGVRAGCLLTVSDTIGAEIVRISDEELRNAVDNMITLALDTLYALN